MEPNMTAFLLFVIAVTASSALPSPKVRLAEPDPGYYAMDDTFVDPSTEENPSTYLESPHLYGGDMIVPASNASGLMYNGGNSGGMWVTMDVADYDGSTKNLHCIPFTIHDSISCK